MAQVGRAGRESRHRAVRSRRVVAESAAASEASVAESCVCCLLSRRLRSPSWLAQENAVARVRAWRIAAREANPAASCSTSSSIPNVAANKGDIQRNARGADADVRASAVSRRRRSPTPGSPVILPSGAMPNVAPDADLLLPLRRPAGRSVASGRTSRRSRRHRRGARAGGAHDQARDVEGQRSIPNGGSTADRRPTTSRRSSRSWPPSTRSTAANIPLTSNIRVIMEGDEEAGSPIARSGDARRTATRCAATRCCMVDGPRHAERSADDVLRRARHHERDGHRLRARRAICTAATTATGRRIRRSRWPGCSPR